MAARKDAKEAEVVKETKAKKTVKTAVKKDAKKATEAVVNLAKDLRNLSEQELHAALKTAKEDLTVAQKMLKANELPSSHVIRKSKKLIARILTVLTEVNDKETK